jgi:hypothetical protein
MSTLTSASTPESRTLSVDRVGFIQDGASVPQGQIGQSEWVEIIGREIQSRKFLLKHSPEFVRVSDCLRVLQGVLVDLPITEETLKEFNVNERLRLRCLISNRLPSITEPPPIPGFRQWLRTLLIDQGGNLFVYYAEQKGDKHKLSFTPVALADLPLTVVDNNFAASALQHNRCLGYLILAEIQDLLAKTLERKKQHVLSLERSINALSLVTSRISV